MGRKQPKKTSGGVATGLFTKKEGGLGVINLPIWNKALLMKNLWNIPSKKDSLWVKWVSHYYLKNSPILEYVSHRDDSALMKNICAIKNQIVETEGSVSAA
jgi:hypothetical protein